MIEGERPVRIFSNKEDVMEIIGLIVEETKEANLNMGKSFDIVNSIFSQLPHFACKNSILNNQYQKDIAMYSYSSEFSISPYKGSYSEQPALWIKKSFIIKNALSKREKSLTNKAKQQGN